MFRKKEGKNLALFYYDPKPEKRERNESLFERAAKLFGRKRILKGKKGEKKRRRNNFRIFEAQL